MRRLLRLAFALLAGLLALQGTYAAGMTWLDLRTEGPDVAAQRQFWSDKLQQAQRQWESGRPASRTLPAFVLVQTLSGRTSSVLVSLLFDMFDCELPGNGAGADLYARCPMRILIGGSPTVRTVERTCLLYVPSAPPDRHGQSQGPDPAQNRTLVSMDNGTLRLRVVQYGRPVPACDADIPLER